MTARCCVRAPICVPTGAKSWSRTHAAANREFDDRGAALWLPIGAGGRPFFPAMWPLWRDAWPPSGSHHGGLEGGLLSRICEHYGDHGRPLAPYRGWRAAFCPAMRSLWRQAWLPSSSHGGWRAAFCPGYAVIMATYIRIATSTQRTHKRNDHMLPQELRTVATQMDPIQEAPEHSTGSCKCWSGLRRLFSLRWYRPRELSCILDEFFTPH